MDNSDKINEQEKIEIQLGDLLLSMHELTLQFAVVTVRATLPEGFTDTGVLDDVTETITGIMDGKKTARDLKATLRPFKNALPDLPCGEQEKKNALECIKHFEVFLKRLGL